MWKEPNLKGDKQLKNNYGPVPLLLICGKIFEKVLHYLNIWMITAIMLIMIMTTNNYYSNRNQ